MKRPAAVIAASAVLLLTSGCTLAQERAEEDPATPTGTGQGTGEVTLVTHDSFSLPKRLIRDFEADTGYDLRVRRSGGAGQLTNKLVLTQGSPIADVAFGVDSTFASRAVEAGVFVPHDTALPPGAERYVLPGGEDVLVPVDNGDVCVNVDTGWFRSHDLAPPTGLDDLVDPAYRGLFVTPGAATSSPGMAFLLATIATYGDGWRDYWADLIANDVAITSGWSDAYYVDYTLGGEGGTRPIVLSYDSSPAFTLTEDGSATSSAALLETCFQQVEYAGILAGAENPDGARAVLEFLLSPRVQAALPDSMYVYPVRDDVDLPQEWAAFAPQPTDPMTLDPAEITDHRQEWLTEWTDIVSR